jgi:L-fuconolactonase
MKVIDAHQHFWVLGKFDYAWLKPDLSVIYRDFLPDDYLPLIQVAGVEQSVLVQADSSIAETDWLLALCGECPQIAGVVGWVDLTSPGLGRDLERLAQNRCFKGVRPSLPALNGDRQILDEGLRLLARHNLSCDVLLKPAVYRNVFDLARRHPGLVFVLDHLAGVEVTPGGHRDWAEALRPLANLPNVVMKLSGYLTAADHPLLPEALQPYIHIALEQFSAGRLMFGSDWPVCTLGGSYKQAVELLTVTTASLTGSEKTALWGGTAQRVYRLAGP